jgi:hypothetical protein
MIMFRVKISPQLVISVQSALPKVVVALLLTTFSYAISGFMIDLMYLIGGIFAMLIAAAGFDPAGAQHTYSVIFPSNATGLYFLTHMIVFDIFFLLSVILNFVASAVSVVAILPSAIFAIIGILLVVWILVLSVWYTFKATWVLLKTLISVYVQIITSPLQFVLAPLVPGFGFGNWFKRLLSDLLVFPVTGVVMFFAWALMWTSYKFAWSSFLTQNILSQIIALITGWMGADTSWFNTIWTPEILGFGKAISGFLFLMASFSLIALIPKVPDMLKGLIMGEKFSFGNAIGEAVGPLNWAYGASGAKGSIDLARRSLEQQRLIRSMKNIEEEQGAIGSFVANLSRSRVGKAIGAGGIVRDVKEGATRH